MSSETSPDVICKVSLLRSPKSRTSAKTRRAEARCASRLQRHLSGEQHDDGEYVFVNAFFHLKDFSLVGPSFENLQAQAQVPVQSPSPKSQGVKSSEGKGNLDSGLSLS